MPSTHIPFDRANCVPSQRLLRAGRSRPARGCDGLNPEEVGMKVRILSPLRLLAQTVPGMGKRVLIVALGMAVSAPCLRAQNAAEANTDKQTIQMLLQRIERLESRVAQLEGTHAGAARTETAMTVHPPAGPAAGPATTPQAPPHAPAQPPEPAQGSEHLQPARTGTTTAARGLR